METVRLLDHYRVSIADDKLAVQLLAHLIRDGAQTEERLSIEIDIGLSETRMKLRDLYRANLVRILPDSLWTINTLAEQILARLGITEVVNRYHLMQLSIESPDLVFLNACISYAHQSEDIQQSIWRSSLIRSVTHVAKESQDQLRPYTLRRLLYAMIVGLAEHAAILGVNDYCQEVLRLATHEVIDREILFENKSRYEAFSKRAIADVQESNHSMINLLLGESGAGKSSLVHTNLLNTITWTRLLSSSDSGKFDTSLRSIAHGDVDRVLLIIDALDEWEPQISESSTRYLQRYGRITGREQSRSAVLSFRSLLSNALEDKSTVSLFTTMDPHFEHPHTAPLGLGLDKRNSSKVVAELRAIGRSLSNAEFDSLTEAEAAKLCDVVYELNQAFQRWFSERYGDLK